MRFPFSVLIVALTITLAGGQTGSPGQSQPKQPGQGRGPMMQRGMAMMEHCRMHCQDNMTAMNTLSKQVDEARQSNDPAKMRAALDAVAMHHAEMKKHMQTCMQNMKSAGSDQAKPEAATPGGAPGSGQQPSPATKEP